jgi:hypothetical protein
MDCILPQICLALEVMLIFSGQPQAYLAGLTTGAQTELESGSPGTSEVSVSGRLYQKGLFLRYPLALTRVLRF